MSLINDALKRATSSKPRPPEQTGPPLQPVEEKPRGPGALPVVLLIVGLGALLISAAFWLKSNSTTTPTAATVPPTVAVKESPAPAPQKSIATPAVAPVNVVTAPTKTVAATPAPPTNAIVEKPATQTPPAPARPAEPELRLQAIYYRFKGPTVVINGQTLKVGDSIAGGKLVSIERTAAEVEINGTRHKLTLQ